MSGFSEVFTTNPQTWVPKQIGKRVFSVHCSQLDHQKSISVTALQVVQSNKYTFLDFFPPLPLFWLAWLCSTKNIFFFYIHKVWVYWWYYLDFNTCILHKIFDYDDFYLFRYIIDFLCLHFFPLICCWRMKMKNWRPKPGQN